MTQHIRHFLDNLQGQSSLGKLLIPAVVLFSIILMVLFFKGGSTHLVLIVGTMLAFYLALNIGANDVANNMGPAVGSGALPIGAAIILAGIFEASGAIIAGGDVVHTIKGGIIDGSLIEDQKLLIVIMLATLFRSELWINIATYTKSPVSATHSVLGGLVGAGIFAIGFSAINWAMIGQIIASWVISPVMGGVIAAFFLWSIDKTIIHQESRHDAAQKWVPIYIAIMAGSFIGYLMMKGLGQMMSVDMKTALAFGLGFGVIVYVGVKKILIKFSGFFKNSKKSINKLFNIPLVFSACLLSFAHGANDVANAIGPFAAIYETVTLGEIGGDASVPIWIMIIGALGLAIGLGVYGSTLIKTVGNEITKLNQIRAYCVALSAAITVIIASFLGLPVSSTHIAIGGILGIGFFRTWQKHRAGSDKEYVDYSIMKHIMLAWVITLPSSALIAGIAYTSIIYFL
ncbi:inorganic phosphate transporter [Candidatus Gracilibacteria bacterium]|nr:inorganic phosphate transporter [Candidatus Gracilibacteria bacterium]